MPSGPVFTEKMHGGGVELQPDRAARLDARKSAILRNNLGPIRQPRMHERPLAKPLDDVGGRREIARLVHHSQRLRPYAKFSPVLGCRSSGNGN